MQKTNYFIHSIRMCEIVHSRDVMLLRDGATASRRPQSQYNKYTRRSFMYVAWFAKFNSHRKKIFTTKEL